MAQQNSHDVYTWNHPNWRQMGLLCRPVQAAEALQEATSLCHVCSVWSHGRVFLGNIVSEIGRKLRKNRRYIYMYITNLTKWIKNIQHIATSLQPSFPLNHSKSFFGLPFTIGSMYIVIDGCCCCCCCSWKAVFCWWRIGDPTWRFGEVTSSKAPEAGSKKTSQSHVSNENMAPGLFPVCRGWNTTQLYGGLWYTIIKNPYIFSPTSIMEGNKSLFSWFMSVFSF